MCVGVHLLSVASSIGYAVIMRLGVVGFIKFLLWVVFVDCVALGATVATMGWLISNKYFLVSPQQSEKVEWGYAFDIHLNALFPVLTILHVFQLFLHVRYIAKFVLAFSGYVHSVMVLLVSNSLWLCAAIYYIYITFLGYTALPYVRRAEILLHALTVLFLVYIATLVFNWDLTDVLYQFYKQRVAS